MDTHSYEADQFKTFQPEPSSEPIVAIPGSAPKATKIRDLSSDIHGVGNTLAKYNEIKETYIVDLDL